MKIILLRITGKEFSEPNHEELNSPSRKLAKLMKCFPKTNT